MKNNHPPFHLAFPVKDLVATKLFYTKVLNCSIGRESSKWTDFNFFGHQITAHLSDKIAITSNQYSKVDEKKVPIIHFGLVLDWEDWHLVKNNLISKKVNFIIKPYIRFRNSPGEQATLFITDPSYNGIELKSFKDKKMLFSS